MGKVPGPRTQHRNNDTPALRDEKHDISLGILHQTGIELALQEVAITQRHARSNHSATSLSVTLTL